MPDPSMIGSLVQAGVQTIGNTINLASGLIGEGKAKRLERSLHRPNYEIPQEDTDTYNLAESQASEGMSEASKQDYAQQAQRGTSQSIDAILKAGGNANNIADLYSNYETGFEKLGIIDEQLRADKQKTYFERSDRMADDVDKQWMINVYAPWADKMQAAKQLHDVSAAKVSGAISNQLQTIGNLASSATFGVGGGGGGGNVSQAKTATTTPIANNYPGLSGGWQSLEFQSFGNNNPN
jgi:hypothetical protein